MSCTKGLENGTLLRMTEVISDVLRSRKFTPRVAALSGPSFAKEVARGDPTAVTVASVDGEVTRAMQQAFNDSRFRVYTNDDVIGVELGGALKNIIAIAAGVCDGLGLGHNSVAALITRGLAEVARLARGLRWPPRYHGRTRRTGRSGSDLHRRSLAQPQRRRRTGQGPQTSATSSRTCTGPLLRAFSPPGRRSAWRAKRTSRCRSPSRCSPSSKPERRHNRPLKN